MKVIIGSCEKSILCSLLHDTLQLVLLGDSGVGKSCIVLRFVRGQFDPASKVFVADSFVMCGIHGALASSSIISFSFVL